MKPLFTQHIDVDYKAIGNRIRELRRGMGYTQENLAELAGISASFMGHIERGEKKASIDTIVQLYGALNTSLEYIVLGIKSTCSEESCPLRDDLAAFARSYGIAVDNRPQL